MICREFEQWLQAFVDGELDVETMMAAQAHVSSCPECHGRVDGERRFRALLRQQPQAMAPPELRARLLGLARLERRRAAMRPWPGIPAAAAARVPVVVRPRHLGPARGPAA